MPGQRHLRETHWLSDTSWTSTARTRSLRSKYAGRTTTCCTRHRHICACLGAQESMRSCRQSLERERGRFKKLPILLDSNSPSPQQTCKKWPEILNGRSRFILHPLKRIKDSGC